MLCIPKLLFQVCISFLLSRKSIYNSNPIILSKDSA